jgi:hypothetical protein
MRHSTTLISIALLSLAQPALSQEQPRVLFCMGQCFGIDKAGERIPLTKGTALAPGLRLETGPDSYLQVKLGSDAAFGMGERARVRLESVGVERAALALDQGRVRVLDGEAIGKPTTRRVELQTSEGNIVLRGADIEVKAPPTGGAAPAPTLVKLNVGNARLGELPVTKDVVHGIVGGKIAREMPMSDIVLRPRGDSPSTAPSRLAVPNLPVTGLTVTNTSLTTAILPTRSITTLDPTLTAIKDLSTLSTTVVSTTQLKPPVVAGTLQLTAPLQTTTGDTITLKQISTTLEATKTTSLTSTTSTTTSTVLLPTIKTDQTLATTTLSPKTSFSTTTFTLR